ncbi:amine oxidase [Elysia marginata]|uniref:Amine oxidase n=1 Tax=Elysia marginata TaxID=1093978 RepID=A0AAV4I6A4_9GAST|nr:amine oxidase [Elysia marginata]
MTSFMQKSGRVWQVTTAILLVVCIGLLIALIVVASEKEDTKIVTLSSDGQAVSACGDSNPNGNTIDLSEPANPGPFHDLTEEEMKKVGFPRSFTFFFKKPPQIAKFKIYGRLFFISENPNNQFHKIRSNFHKESMVSNSDTLPISL